MLVLAATTACRGPHQIRTSDYVGAVNQVAYSITSPVPTVEAVPPQVSDLVGPHAVDEYISYALSQNSDIEATRKRVDAAAYRVPRAASLRDPTFGVTAFPEAVQTAAGQQDVLRAQVEVSKLDDQLTDCANKSTAPSPQDVPPVPEILPAAPPAPNAHT